MSLYIVHIFHDERTVDLLCRRTIKKTNSVWNPQVCKKIEEPWDFSQPLHDSTTLKAILAVPVQAPDKSGGQRESFAARGGGLGGQRCPAASVGFAEL